MHGRRSTIRDVAARAGVSIKSVSRVVNDEPGVSTSLADRVREAIDELGYQHNLSASNLRRGNRRSRSIGLVLQDVSNPFEAALHRAVEVVARSTGSAVLAGSVEGDAVLERQLVTELTRRRVDGIVVMPTAADHAYLADERRLGMEVVFVDRPGVGLGADTVTADNRGGSRAGVAHLVAHGHRRIAFLGDDRSVATAVDRHAGYLDALDDAAIERDETIEVHGVGEAVLAHDAARRLLQSPDPPTAIFAARNFTAHGVIIALRELGARHRVAVVGFDDFPLADLLEPGLTVVAQDPHLIGTRAAELLFERLTAADARRAATAAAAMTTGTGTDDDDAPPDSREPSDAPYVNEVTGVRLIPRGSGEIPA
jgi:LacI family transcriptional regulator